MSLFGKKEPEYFAPSKAAVPEEPEITEVPAAKAPAPTTVIGEDTVFVGDIVSDEPIEIKGTVKGNIKSTDKVTVSSSGSHTGKSSVRAIDISGNVKADIECEDLTCIKPSGRLTGTLATAKLATEIGSCFDGSLSLSADRKPQARRPEPEKEFFTAMAEEAKAAEDAAEEGDVAVTEADIFG
jgi:cytoskeletal protein CcmA (bactofilin family)